jgi:hypothetical protein
MFRSAAITTFFAIVLTATTVKSECTLCYDYSDFSLDLGAKECTERTLFKKIKDHHKAKAAETGQKCKKQKDNCGSGGLTRELMALTKTSTNEKARASLQTLCDDALAQATSIALSNSGNWGSLEGEGSIELDDYFEGHGFLNNETGNLQQDEKDFIKKGGYDRFNYVGSDPRQNDHYRTSETSYQAGESIYNFYNEEAKKSFLSAPTVAFGKENDNQSCEQTNAAVCCWMRDRQYFDNNGNCGSTDCANQNPGDNTDLCWTEDNNEVFPFPGDETEQDLHCHGLAWGMEFDVNTNAKWNNLFFVSMYDHLYMRGYAESITNDAKIMGEQAMCGCVEDMAPVARADCTETIGHTNTTVAVSDNGLLLVDHVTGSFELEFRACEGYNYVEDFGPKDYEENPDAADLESSTNDLSAFVYRLYLEGQIDLEHTMAFNETVIGYTKPEVNIGDEEREAVCKAAFKDRYPEEEWVEKVTDIVAEE